MLACSATRAPSGTCTAALVGSLPLLPPGAPALPPHTGYLPRSLPGGRSTQDEPAFCGLASLAMVLNALSIDPRRTWKGAWRWFHEAMLDCCRPLDSVKQDGITLYQVGAGGLARVGG
jgi:hypothetical protein